MHITSNMILFHLKQLKQYDYVQIKNQEDTVRLFNYCYESTLNMFTRDICIELFHCSCLYNSTYTESQAKSQEHHSLYKSVKG